MSRSSLRGMNPTFARVVLLLRRASSLPVSTFSINVEAQAPLSLSCPYSQQPECCFFQFCALPSAQQSIPKRQAASCSHICQPAFIPAQLSTIPNIQTSLRSIDHSHSSTGRRNSHTKSCTHSMACSSVAPCALGPSLVSSRAASATRLGPASLQAPTLLNGPSFLGRKLAQSAQGSKMLRSRPASIVRAQAVSTSAPPEVADVSQASSWGWQARPIFIWCIASRHFCLHSLD